MPKNIVVSSPPSPLTQSDLSMPESPTDIALPSGGIHHRSSTAAFQHAYNDPAPSPTIFSSQPPLSEGLEKEVNSGILLNHSSSPRNAISPLPFSGLRGSFPSSRKQSVVAIPVRGGEGTEDKTRFSFPEASFRSALRKESNTSPEDVSRAVAVLATSPRCSQNLSTHLSVPFATGGSYARMEGEETPLLLPSSLAERRLERRKESLPTRGSGNNPAQGIYSTFPRQYERGEKKATPSPMHFSSFASPISHPSGISGNVVMRRASSYVISEGKPSPEENSLSPSTSMASKRVGKGRSKSTGEGKSMEESMNQGEDTVLLVMAGNPRPSHFNAVHTARKAYRDLEDDHAMLWGELTELKQRYKRTRNIALYSLLPAMMQLKTEWIHTKSSVRNALNTFWGYFSTYHDLLRRAIMQHIMEDDFDADGEEEDNDDEDDDGDGTNRSSTTWRKRHFSQRIYSSFPTLELLPHYSFSKKEILYPKNTEENRPGGREGGTRRKKNALSRGRRPLSFLFTSSCPFESQSTRWRERILQEEEGEEEATAQPPQHQQQQTRTISSAVAVHSKRGKSVTYGGFSAFQFGSSDNNDESHSGVTDEKSNDTNNADDRRHNRSRMGEDEGGKKNETCRDKDGNKDEEEEEDGSFLPCLSVTSVPTTGNGSDTGTGTPLEHAERTIEDETERREKQTEEQRQRLVGECPHENRKDKGGVESLPVDFLHSSSPCLVFSPPFLLPSTTPIDTTYNDNNMAATSTEGRETEVSSPSEPSCTLSSSSTRDLEEGQCGEGRSKTSLSEKGKNREEKREGKKKKEAVLAEQEEVLKVPLSVYRAMEKQLAEAQRALVEVSQKREYDKETFQTRMNQMHRMYILREHRMTEEIRLYHRAMECMKGSKTGLTEEEAIKRKNEKVHQIQCFSMHEHGGISPPTPLSLPGNGEGDGVSVSSLGTEMAPGQVEKMWKSSSALTEEVVKKKGIVEENKHHSPLAVAGISPLYPRTTTSSATSSSSSSSSSRASGRIVPEKLRVPSDPSPSCSSSVLPWWKRDELWNKALTRTKRQEKKKGGVLHTPVRRECSTSSVSSFCTSLAKTEGWTSKYREQKEKTVNRRPNTTMRTTTLLNPDYYSPRCAKFFTKAVERLGLELEKEQKRKRNATRRNRTEKDENKVKYWKGGEYRRSPPNITHMSCQDPSRSRGRRRNISALPICNSKKQEEGERKPLSERTREVPSAMIMDGDETHYVIAQGMWAEQLLLERSCRRRTAAW